MVYFVHTTDMVVKSKGVDEMAMTTAMSKNFTDSQERTVSVSFNGKIYNGKRYIKCQYRLNSTKSGLKEATYIWQDGLGWVDSPLADWSEQITRLFGLK